MNDDRPRDTSGRPVVNYRISFGATLMFTATMLVIYFLGRNAVVYDPLIETQGDVREAIEQLER